MDPPTKRSKQTPLVFTVTEVTSLGRRINIYGRERDTGKSVYAYTDSFYPYFYALGIMDNLESRIEKHDEPVAIYSIESVQRTPVMEYHPNGPMNMYKITMTTPNYLTMARNILEHNGILTYEASISFVVRFMADHGFGGNDWIQLDEYSYSNDKSRCDIEVEFNQLKRRSDLDDLGKMRWLAFDIEACKDGHGFVDPTAPNDIISQIGMTLYESDYTILDKRVLCVGPGISKLPNNVESELFATEQELLFRFRDYICERNPDAFTGYNIDGFDWWYIFGRAKTLGILKEFVQFSKLLNRGASIKKAFFASAAKGARNDYETRIEGRFNFDMYKFMKDTQKCRSFQLGAISEQFLGDSKVEMPYEDIPRFQNGTDEQRAHLSYYCWYDADLCRRLMERQMCIVNNVETSRVCGVPMKFLITRGQQVLTTRLFLAAANARNFVLPSSTENQNDEDTQGATVLDPMKGFYRYPIVVLDFQSLYPSIMRDRNICYSSKAPKKWLKTHLKPGDYYIPPIPGCNYGYVKEHIHQGILSEIEESLFNRRLMAKADMKREKDPRKKEVLDGRQLAIKVRMNSIYGYLKANTVCDKDLMETVTGEGRYMIEQTKNLIEERYPGAKVVYGDSVTGDTPCLVYNLQTKQMNIVCIETLNQQWNVQEKEYGVSPLPFLVWTEQGWTVIRRVIRHKTNKPIVRVVTETGVVDCTTDHGLVTFSGKRVSPDQVSVGDDLLHSYPITESPTSESVGDAFIFTDKLKAAKAYFTFCYFGYHVRINVIEKSNTYEIIRSKAEFPHRICRIEPLGTTDDYVYDLETENHHFHAGVGQMIVHNTDSVFVKFGEDITVPRAFELGTEAAALCTQLFTKERLDIGKKGIHVLQMEKTFDGLLLVGKKKYAGYKQMGVNEKPFLDSSGLETVRRDNALIASETMQTCLEMILVKKLNKTPEDAIQYVHSAIRDLLMGRIEMSKLIISKNLSKTFKHYEESGSALPHVVLAKRIKARMHKTGESEYHTGDRVKYVLIKGTKKSKSSDCAEDPLYAMENRLPIDYAYYVENQMMKPLLRIFTPILAPGESMLKTNKKGDNVYINQKELEQLTAYRRLFTGEHMQQKVVRVKEGAAGIMQFAKIIPSCVGCGCKAPSGICPSCEPRKAVLYLTMVQEQQRLEQKQWAAWTRCQACVGDKHVHKIACSNKDCDNFYEREKVIMDIEDLMGKMGKL